LSECARQDTKVIARGAYERDLLERSIELDDKRREIPTRSIVDGDVAGVKTWVATIANCRATCVALCRVARCSSFPSLSLSHSLSLRAAKQRSKATDGASPPPPPPDITVTQDDRWETLNHHKSLTTRIFARTEIIRGQLPRY